MGALEAKALPVEGELLPTQGITAELIQQVREVRTMKSTMAEKVLRAKRVKRHNAMAARRANRL